jgi:hypothetical protein
MDQVVLTMPLINLLRRLIASFRHVRSGGASTRRKAARRAALPPRKCPTCRQPVPHSHDYRDHVTPPGYDRDPRQDRTVW